jgi:hypothetical protein
MVNGLSMLDLHLEDPGDMGLPMREEVVEIMEKLHVGFRLDGEEVFHSHCCDVEEKY